eukprot:CAMPEP_0180627786 /NCGR_PEP_ID=MMETSP1037_2-20121125/38559_1 /TAXON_ID=632150 /ORGANISM="Azadinium spinosum, Strain 3D9" /LENGTH=151 /DNA_ID=CAMNT_0022648435 /DNA_START=1 /DNA_END=453 /DNA_ORIENTATION=+
MSAAFIRMAAAWLVEWTRCAAAVPYRPAHNNVMKGTVKSYNTVKGFGFLLHPDIQQDIWFARESLSLEFRTSNVAGAEMNFELYYARDGKPQARNLWPVDRDSGAVKAAAEASGGERMNWPKGAMNWPGGLPGKGGPMMGGMGGGVMGGGV